MVHTSVPFQERPLCKGLPHQTFSRPSLRGVLLPVTGLMRVANARLLASTGGDSKELELPVRPAESSAEITSQVSVTLISVLLLSPLFRHSSPFLSKSPALKSLSWSWLPGNLNKPLPVRIHSAHL